MQTALLAGLIVSIFVCIASPLLWVAMINLVGLRRILERVSDLEDLSDKHDAKGKSLQAQIRKTKVRSEPPDPDAEINAELDRLMRGNGADPNPVRLPPRGGVKDG